MKFRRLDLLAFGPFTDVSLDFSRNPRPSAGLHLVYGPNEAGKSSALRALGQLLFGIPHVCSDDFIHPYSRLRIGAELEKSDGRRLSFVRLKGKSNTLRTPDEADPLEASLLDDFLGGITEDRFSQMFGIDHAGLIRGGREIIQGGGEMGQILFAGGSGIANLRAVQEELRAEADALFRPSAQKRTINAALADLKTVRREMRDAQLSADEWSGHATALETATAEKERLTATLAEKMRERNSLERIGKALPFMGRRRELTAALADCADAPHLPEDFPERRRDLQTALRTAEAEREGAEKTVAEIRLSLNKLMVDRGVLTAAETVESLYQEVGSVRKAEKDRRRLTAMKSGDETEAKTLLKGLRNALSLEEAQSMRLDRAESVRIQELGAAMERLLTRSESGREEAVKLELRIERLRRRLADLGEPADPSPLQAAVDAARGEGHLQETHRTETAALERDRSKATAQYKRLGSPGDRIETVGELLLPEMESIDLFEGRLADGQAAAAREKGAVSEARKALSEIARDLCRIEMEGAIPSEADLRKAREHRDDGWAAVRDVWLGGAAPAAAAGRFSADVADAGDLARAYEARVLAADALSDRLRREAGRVARKAALRADQQTRKEELERLETSLASAEAADAENQSQWTALWAPAGVTPRSPREMRPWRQNLTRLIETVAALREREVRQAELAARITAHEGALRRALDDSGRPPPAASPALGDLLRMAADRAAALEKHRTARDAALREIQDREDELREIEVKARQAEADLVSWRSEWAAAVAPLGLDEGASPAQANTVLEDIRSLMVKFKDIDVFRKRIQGIDRDAATFRDKATELASRIAPDLSAEDPEEIAIALNRRLTMARTAETEEKALRRRRVQEEERFRKATERISAVQAQLAALCEEGGCRNPEGLPEAEKRSRQRREIEQSLAAVESRLRELSGGVPVQAFLETAGAVDPDAIEPRALRLGEEIEALEARKSELDQAIGRERSELKRMDGSGRAADLAADAENILARIRSDAEHCIRLKLASAVLQGAIERYREKHQGPILRRAESLFSRMTLESFEGLRLEFTDKGDAILVGVRPGGKETVGVTGMSEGTADQLYLAVRLASLETYLAKHEPMPFIVDDILIQFDDRRAIATLDVLAELSEKIQVIVFTHHRHLLDLARERLPAERRHIHYLAQDPDESRDAHAQ